MTAEGTVGAPTCIQLKLYLSRKKAYSKDTNKDKKVTQHNWTQQSKHFSSSDEIILNKC
jgi:hypothetical protein